MKLLFKICMISLFVFVVCFGQITLMESKKALSIWFEQLIPSMMVSMVLVRVLYKQDVFSLVNIPYVEKLFKIDSNSFILVICSMFLGFPNGAIFIDEACGRKEIGKAAAQRLIYCCSFAAPGFVILTCGLAFFHSLSIGFLLFLCQILSVFLLLLFTRHTPVAMFPKIQSVNLTLMQSLSAAIKESAYALFMIGGYLMLFMSCTSVLFQFFPFYLNRGLRIISEFSGGMILLHDFAFDTLTLQLLSCLLIGFGGFCVHLQIRSLICHTPFTYSHYLFFRAMQAFLACGFYFCLNYCFR